MKKHPLTLTLLIATFLTALTIETHATVSIESTINDNINTVINFKNLDTNTYNTTKTNQQLNSTTIPQTIIQNLRNQNQTQANYNSQTITYNDTTQTIQASFILTGSNIISHTLNRTTMKRNYTTKTEWRKFKVNLTDNVTVDFAERFAQPVANWRKTSQVFYYETSDANVGSLSFSFILPPSATNVQATGDTITFDVSSSFEDIFLSSPFLILAAILIAVAITLVYRKLR